MKRPGLNAIVPAGLFVADDWEQGAVPQLLAAEADSLGRVADKRRADFARGRACARGALDRIGIEPCPILRGPMREPLWPAGVVGSITHCEGYSAAVVGRGSEWRSVGIDAERHRPLTDGVLRMVASATERASVDRQLGGMPWGLILFSAKESVFKAWYPVARTWLGFDEAEVEFNADSRAFVARLRPKVGPSNDVSREIRGRFHVDETHIYTFVGIDVNVAGLE